MRMPSLSRESRQLLTCWLSHSRVTGSPQMTRGWALENSPRSKGNTKELDELLIANSQYQVQAEVDTAYSGFTPIQNLPAV
jgi:hypothetical protein